MDATRKRHERQIAALRTSYRNEFANALYTVMNRRPGLSWFTDEQVADLRAEMLSTQWFRHKLNRENRKRRIA